MVVMMMMVMAVKVMVETNGKKSGSVVGCFSFDS
jgi:hypothetical protein